MMTITCPWCGARPNNDSNAAVHRASGAGLQLPFELGVPPKAWLAASPLSKAPQDHKIVVVAYAPRHNALHLQSEGRPNPLYIIMGMKYVLVVIRV